MADLLRAEGIAPPEARVGDKRPASPTDILDLTLVDEDDVDVNEIKQLEVFPSAFLDCRSLTAS
jgi:hypothetical protein